MPTDERVQVDPSAPTSSTVYVPRGVLADAACLERAWFGDPLDSSYVLPFAVGRRAWVSQSYCLSDGGHNNQLAYDFDLRIGDDVLASRSGVVKSIRQDSPDDGQGYGEHNFVFIEHDDGTVAFYAHLMQDSVAVAIGDAVAAGDLIALSGNSGLTGHPHLHFGVYQDWPPVEGRDVPVSFRNAAGRLDPRGGLYAGLIYEATPWE